MEGEARRGHEWARAGRGGAAVAVATGAGGRGRRGSREGSGVAMGTVPLPFGGSGLAAA